MLVPLILAAMVALPVAGAFEPANEDIATLSAEIRGANQSCTVGAESFACPIRVYVNNSTRPGDDSVASAIYVDNVTVTVRPPAGNLSDQNVTFDARSVVIHHPVFQDLNATWPVLNDSRPDAVRPYVAFESRPLQTCSADGTWQYGEWGLFVTVYPPSPNPAARCGSVSVSWCYDYCFLDDEEYMQQTDSTITPFPNGIALIGYQNQPADTDSYVPADMDSAKQCFYYTFVPCEAGPARPMLDWVESAYNDSAPDVAFGVEVNSTTVAVNPTNGTWSEPESSSSNLTWPNHSWVPYRPPVSSAGLPHNHPVQLITTGPVPDHIPPPPPSRGAPVPHVQSMGGDPVNSASALAIITAVGTATALAALGAWVLYHRFGKRDALKLETRARIHDFIVASPGLRASEIAARLNLDHKTVTYHLRKLVAWGIVRPDGSKRARYYSADKPELDPRTAALTRPTLHKLYTVLKTLGEADHSALAAASDLSLPTVSRGLRCLETVGLVVQKRVGRRVVASPNVPPAE